MNASARQRLPRFSPARAALPIALALWAAGCGPDASEPPTPPDNPAARWSVPAAREDAPPAIPTAALAKPVMSEAERRAIAEARLKPAAPAPTDTGAPPATLPPVDPTPAAPGELSREDLAALRDDPAARPLPDPEPIEAMADVPRAVLPAPTDTAIAKPAAPAAPSPPQPAAPAVDPPGAGTSPRPGVLIAEVSDANLTLLDLALAPAVVNREPEGASDRFEETPPLFVCFTSFDQRSDPMTITHVWTWNDREMARVELEVGKSPKWRTWSRQRLQPEQTGRWACEVLGPDGRRLGLARVTVGR
jgi:hypothetical protein